MKTDRTTKVLLALIAIALFLNTIVPLVQPRTVQAQETPTRQVAEEPLEGEAWRMHSSATANRTWLYSAQTGKVYYVFGAGLCSGDLGEYGCMGAVPVFSEEADLFLPYPR